MGLQEIGQCRVFSFLEQVARQIERGLRAGNLVAMVAAIDIDSGLVVPGPGLGVGDRQQPDLSAPEAFSQRPHASVAWEAGLPGLEGLSELSIAVIPVEGDCGGVSERGQGQEQQCEEREGRSHA